MAHEKGRPPQRSPVSIIRSSTSTARSGSLWTTDDVRMDEQRYCTFGHVEDVPIQVLLLTLASSSTSESF
jgi:hypothetical protein